MFRTFTLILIALVPLASVRHALYRFLFGYRVLPGSHIGWFSYINCRECRIEGAAVGSFNQIVCQSICVESGARIGRFNKFVDCGSVVCKRGSAIGNRNNIMGTRPGISPFKEQERFELGNKSIITASHHFDLSDSITIGDEVTIGGSGCQIWTHGFDPNRIKVQAPVSIGDSVYVGSRTIIVQGVSICSNVSIAAGTVVSKSISEPGFYVSSQLIRKGDAPDYSRNHQLVEYENARFVRK